jgi:hypothetical protein
MGGEIELNQIPGTFQKPIGDNPLSNLRHWNGSGLP